MPRPAAQRVTAFLASLRRDDGSFASFQTQGPKGERIDTSFFPDRPLADRARKAETLSAARVFDQLGIQYTDANGRDGVIADKWTVLASCSFDLDTGRATTQLHEDFLLGRQVDVQALQAALDARPRHTKPDRRRDRVNRLRAAGAATTPAPPDAPTPTASHHDGTTQPVPPPNIFAPAPPP